MTASLMLLKQILSRQSKKILGWQNTQCVNVGFKQLPPRAAYIQVLHVSGCHWVTVSNLNPKDGSCSFNSASIYDSIRPMSITLNLKKQICSFTRPTSEAFVFELMNIQTQTNSSDCGVFALAAAVELVEGHNPVVCYWDCTRMRSHLLQCLMEGRMIRFPLIKQRHIRFGQSIRKSEVEKIYCLCRMPNDKALQMVECTRCLKWYHNNCVELKSEENLKDMKWICPACIKLLQ